MKLKLLTMLEKSPKDDIESLGATLHKYTNKELIKKEDKAWELHVKEKYK